MRSWLVQMLGLAVASVVPAIVVAQTPGASPPAAAHASVVPAVAFEVAFEKFTPPANVYSPYYAWDAKLGFDVTVYRRGRHAAEFLGVMQSAGTENFGTRIGVGGAGYLLRIAYRHDHSATTGFRAGMAHLSSHLTRDLDQKTADERQRGVPVPDVQDPSEYNVLFLEGTRRFVDRRLAPEIRLGFSPVNLRLDGRVRGGYRRPVYAGTRWTIRQSERRALTLETEHEIGTNPVNRITLAWETRSADMAGTVHVFVSVSPGSGLHVSPDLGAVRDGISVGVRLRVD